ncbi:MAG: DUF3365 domain-containing protein [Planctomycetes bacterium]|nr:DUF3365 domain-containing protein [Planctomycetota bacterium]
MTFDALRHAVLRRPVRAAAVVALAGATLLVLHLDGFVRGLIEFKTVRDAELYAQALAEFRTVYTSEVVETVRSKGILVTHDYVGKDGAIPLPATLSMLLGERIGGHGTGAETRLYSPFPFPWRAATGGLRDDFGKAAWISFQARPDEPFSRFETVGGRPVLRYAVADRMRRACVDCHNSHADSPRRDWQVGDVRGVLEVRLPMDRAEAAMREGLRGTLLLLVGLGLGGLGLLTLLVNRYLRAARELERHIAELQAGQRKLAELNQELLVARDGALAASRAKSRFLAVMSHELRTPLNHILGYAEMVEEEAPAALRPDLGKIRGAGMHLLTLVTDTLEFAKVEAGTTSLALESFSVAEFLTAVTREFVPLAAEKGLTLDIVCAPDVGHAFTDSAKLHRCLWHLLANAVKYTERGGIAVNVTRESAAGAAFIRFAVRDTGVGIAADQFGADAEAFAQADNTTTRRHGGMGLGLPLAHGVARLLGGEVTVRGTPGQGSTFELRIRAELRSPGGTAG